MHNFAYNVFIIIVKFAKIYTCPSILQLADHLHNVLAENHINKG